jgi:hypothetical protein
MRGLGTIFLLAGFTDSLVVDPHGSLKTKQFAGIDRVEKLRKQPSIFSAGIVPNMPSPQWFGSSFRDSPAAYNAWVDRPEPKMINDLFPTAKYDRLDDTMIRSWSGSAPVQPNVVGNVGLDMSYLHPDWLPPYLHPAPFPAEAKLSDYSSSDIPIGNRHLLANPDRLRPLGRFHDDAAANYPLVAPADRLMGGHIPVAEEDKIPKRYVTYVHQLHDSDIGRRYAVAIDKIFHLVDTDKDGSISSQEYDAELQGHQKKNAEMSQKLWAEFHKSESEDMSEEDFKNLAETGFDLGKSFVPRKDIALTMTTSSGTPLGYWGGGTVCPDGKFVVGVALKVQPLSTEHDNTAVNAIKFICDDGTEITTAEGPDGEWTDPAKCPEEQFVYSLRIRNRVYEEGIDNTGINDFMFFCRTKSLSETSELRFGNPEDSKDGILVAKGNVAKEGGWENELTCGASLFLCGAQVRLLTEQGEGDDMGVSDIRFFCCTAPVDCSASCSTDDVAACQACHDASTPVTDHNALIQADAANRK